MSIFETTQQARTAIINNLVNNNTLAAEISMLLNEAKDRVTDTDVARAFTNEYLSLMPEIVKGKYNVQYTDDRGNEESKMQSRNLALWTVVLNTVVMNRRTSYQLIAESLRTWVHNNFGTQWSEDSATDYGKQFVKAMQALEILSTDVQKETIVLGRTEVEVAFLRLSERMTAWCDTKFEQLQSKVAIVNRPLANVPMDWTDTMTGVGENAGMCLIKNQKYRGKRVASGVLSAVNKLQKVKFTVAPAIIDAAYDIRDNADDYMPELRTDENMRKFKFLLDVSQEITKYQDEEFYFPVTMDNRGRMYYRGGILSPQSADFCKAAFQFAEYKELGTNGYRGMMIHVANVFGQDKLSISDRIDWVESNWNEIINMKSATEIANKFRGADKFQALVAAYECNRLQHHLADCEVVSSFSTNLVCHQDGTCNGLQHMAAITKNRQTAETVNCVASTDNDVPQDIYGIIADAAAELADLRHLYAEKALITKYGRDMAKNPVMITGYGAGESTIIANTVKYLADKRESGDHGEEIGKLYIEAITLKAGAVSKYTAVIKRIMKNAVKNGHGKFSWKTMDGFIACTQYRDSEGARVRAGAWNAVMYNSQQVLDTVKTEGAMAPNLIHSIDATHLRLVINQCEHDLVTVHDSIGSHACDYATTAKAIREQFVAVHTHDVLEGMCEHINERAPQFRGDYDASEALQSTYIFS